MGGHPDNYTTFIDPNLLVNSTHYINLTNYYKKMSLGVFKVTGQAISVETPKNKVEYFAMSNPRYEAIKDVIINKVDPIIDFRLYDNWSSSSNYHHQNQPDGTVDLIVMVWRGLVFSQDWSGEASLGHGNQYTVENGAKTIKTWFALNDGSGVTVQYWGERLPERNFHVAVHEVGHWLLGGSHPYLMGSADQHNFWGMMTLGSDGICANTFERERVAWINPTPITDDILNAPFQDYVEYGSAYKYHPPNGEANEYYYFENHQKLNIYDYATSNTNDKGIFVLHQRNIYNETNNIRCKTSNGQWNWDNSFNTNCWGVDLPAFKPLSVNRSGYNNRDMIPKNGGGSEWLYALINSSGNAICGDWKYGGGLNNSFNLTYNDVFSPYSNPYTHTWLNTQNNFTMEVIAQNGSVINARFYINNPLDGKPSKPPLGFFHAGEGPIQYGWAYLAWGADYWDGQPIESDINWSELQRKIGTNGTWVTVYSGSNRWWSDNSIVYDPQNGDVPVFFRVRVRDSQNKWSIWSDLYDTRTFSNENSTEKIQAKNILNIIPSEYSLSTNYPNPFNPSTIINYAVKEAGLVSIKVFDILGAEIATLVNESKEAGEYAIEFNASTLPSGVYIYTMQVNGFTSSRKMLLMK